MEAALEDLPRAGRPGTISGEEKAWIIDIACQKPVDLGYPQELWTMSKLQKHVRGSCEASGYPGLKTIAVSKIWAILNGAEIKPHKIRYYLEKRDPEFKEKMNEVLVVYKQLELQCKNNDNNGRVAVSYDEKPGIQAVANTAADLLPGREHGFIARDSEYVRLGTVSLPAGMDLHTGEIIPLVSETHKSSDFICFLKLLDEKYNKDLKIRIILDNHSAHTSKETMRYLAGLPGRFEFVFTPKHGSWLNLIESFFGKMTRVFFKGIRVKSKEELVDRIYRYINEVNTVPVVYLWKFKMDDISV
jgi:transposase